MIKIITIPVKTALSLIVTMLLFASIPVIYKLLGTDLIKKDASIDATPVLMQVEAKKPEKKSIQELKPRQILSHSGPDRSRSFTMKFTPDLNVGSAEGVAVEEENLENVVFEEGETDVPPIPIAIKPIPYPKRAREAGIEGTVDITFTINRKGEIEQVIFNKIPHIMFKNPILKTVTQWKFKPAMNKGIPVKIRANKVIEFSLDE